jgi:putative membrane protein
MIISEADKARIEDAIKEAESKTSAEIVAVIARASGEYYYAPYLWAALAALTLPWPLILWTWIPVEEIYLMQLALFAGLALILHYSPLRYALVPPSIKRRNAHRKAMEQFIAQNLYTTPNRTGVLIFISAAERYVEIIADSAAHREIPESEWRESIDDLTASIGRGEAAEGLVQTIRRIGEHLAAHFPAAAHQEHLLPNHLIILGIA